MQTTKILQQQKLDLSRIFILIEENRKTLCICVCVFIYYYFFCDVNI